MPATNMAVRTVVLALPESPVTSETAQRLRASGWRVHRVADSEGLRRLACRMTPEVVVLPADGTDESGWLTCAKLLTSVPRPRVIVVGELTPDTAELARFIGAEAPVPADATAAELVDHIEESVVQST